MKKILIAFAAITSLIVGCTDPNEGSLFVQPTNIETEMSMTTILERSPETYSMWIELLKYTNYYNAVKDANADALVFSPNNDAIQRFLDNRGLTSIEELDLNYAREVVQSHIIDWTSVEDATKVTDSSLVSMARAGEYITTRNLFNQYLTLTFGYKETDVDDDERTDETFSSDSIFINNQAKLGRFVGSVGSNGIIYMMDDVIVPNAENIVEKLEILSGENNTFRIFADAIKADPAIYKMATTERDTTTGIGGAQVITDYTYTCFAVPDYIMNAAGITDVESLKQWLLNNSNGEEVDPDTALNHYLKYHFLPTQYTMDEIFNFTDPTETLIYDTQYTGQAFIANLVNNKRTINTNIPVLRSDIEASNGLITKVGGVMPVYHPTPVNVKWDFLNSADIITIINKYGSQNAYGNIFTSKLGTSEIPFDFCEEDNQKDYGTPTSFTYELTESSSNKERIGFIKDAYYSSSQAERPRHDSFMNNYLLLNLGFAGWIEFTTPTIIAGKYKVVLHYIKDTALMQLYSSGTLVQFNLDDEDYQNLSYLYRGTDRIPPTGTLEGTLWNEVEFDGSAAHKFRITMRDVQAKTMRNYHIRLDYVEFIPIE